ncbi:hornerin-like [Iris pallida]|uniref:Hornerin-like n=1 Tax=Iris pallida TaxID=29817 RepID=A0AAX6G844_IRIPA|nr:hornerin-like [Iris pallida]
MRPNELIVARPVQVDPPATWPSCSELRCRLQRLQRTRRLTTRCWKRANFLVVLGGAPGAAAKLTDSCSRGSSHTATRGTIRAACGSPGAAVSAREWYWTRSSAGSLLPCSQLPMRRPLQSVTASPANPSCPCSKPDRIRETPR